MQNNEVLIKMSREMGEMHGTLKTHIEKQDITNHALYELSKGHDKEIKSLNVIKNRLLGLSLVASCIAALSAISK